MIIGIVRREGAEVRAEMLPVSLPPEALLPLVPAEVRPTAVLRFSAPCASKSCAHFDEGTCRLASRIATRLPELPGPLRPCAIRPTCKWFRQERAAACRRCAHVVTEPYAATPLMEAVATPAQSRNKEPPSHDRPT
jgi:hypothetical protein